MSSLQKTGLTEAELQKLGFTNLRFPTWTFWEKGPFQLIVNDGIVTYRETIVDTVEQLENLMASVMQNRPQIKS